MVDSLLNHWPEYLIEAGLLGTFMFVACVAVFFVQHPRSTLAQRITHPSIRRVIIGILMGLTAIALIYSPLGQRSGAHMNPGTTLTFLVLDKIRPWDAVFYVLVQFIGAIAGVRLAEAALGQHMKHEAVNYAATVPGRHGVPAAWIAEFVIAFGMMSMVLFSTNHAASAPYTGVFAGVLVAVYIAIEAPLSGMSMNPARTLGSAIYARSYRGLWIYFTAPPLAMLCAAWLYVAIAGRECVYCAKMNHTGHERCIFNCRIEQMPGRGMNLSIPTGIKREEPPRRPAAEGR